MEKSNTIAAVQFSTENDPQKNIEYIERDLDIAVKKGAQYVIFPEEFLTLSMAPEEKLRFAQPEQMGIVQEKLSNLAKAYGIWLIGGTLPISVEGESKYFSRCIVWNSAGHVVGHYDKIHLFDVRLGNDETYVESESVKPGDKVTVISTPMGKMGIAICYDIRFPELFRRMASKGAEIMVLPSAFTKPTGKAHWEILIRARAIENLCYFVAVDQVGVRRNGLGTHGHSMIVDPWGEIMVQAGEGPEVITASLDREKLRHIREHFPSLTHRRLS